MIHEESAFSHAGVLLNLLDDGDAIILVHVDVKSQNLFALVSSLIQERKTTKGSNCNIHLASKRFVNVWGHISLVYTQLNGFWELLDMAEWYSQNN